jgi:type 1 fimbria pilin
MAADPVRYPDTCLLKMNQTSAGWSYEQGDQSCSFEARQFTVMLGTVSYSQIRRNGMNKLTTRLHTFISAETTDITIRIFICDIEYKYLIWNTYIL